MARWLLTLPELCEGLKRVNAVAYHAIFHKKSANEIKEGIREAFEEKRRSHFVVAKLFIREVLALPEKVCLKILWTACGDGDIVPVGTSEINFNTNLI